MSARGDLHIAWKSLADGDIGGVMSRLRFSESGVVASGVVAAVSAPGDAARLSLPSLAPCPASTIELSSPVEHSETRAGGVFPALIGGVS